LDEATLTLTGLVASVDGKRLDSVTGPANEAEHLGIQLAQNLRQQGAQILDEIFKAVQRTKNFAGALQRLDSLHCYVTCLLAMQSL